MAEAAEIVLAFIAWWVPVAYFAFASYIVYTVGGHNEQARNWLAWLFIVIFVIVCMALYTPLSD